MNVLVTGSEGQLGHDTIDELFERGHNAIGVDVKEMDVRNYQDVINTISRARVDAVVHCAAYTAVDRAETEVDICNKINVTGTRNVSLACKNLGIKLMYISTDYVFNGTGINFWKPDDVCDPINLYGKSKYEGELAVEELVEKYYIVRISWVFGQNGKNFVKTMLQLSKERKSISVVNDQIGSPTYTKDLSRLLVDMIETDKYGKYHATNEGICSWYEFACEIFSQAGIKIEVTPISSDCYPSQAKRPTNSRMSKEDLDKNGFEKLPHWKDAVRRYLEDANRQEV